MKKEVPLEDTGGLTPEELAAYKQALAEWKTELQAAQQALERCRDELTFFLKGHSNAAEAFNAFAFARRQALQLRNALIEQNGISPGLLVATQMRNTNTAADRAACSVYRDALKMAFEQVSRGLLGNCDTSVPLLMMPVRLETRFAWEPGGNRPQALKIRVYPDDIHIDRHEPELTAEEQGLGRQYWDWRAAFPDDATSDRAAWSVLAQRLGPRRAAWVISASEPSALSVGSRPGTWTQAARAELLPERWVALAYRGSATIGAAVGRRISPTLAAGPSPKVSGNEDAIAWLTDYDRALDSGMAVTLAINTDADHDGRIDRLLVLGIRTGSDAAKSATELGQLLTAHRFTSGLGIVARNTPTNNTESASAGTPNGQSPDPAQSESDRIYALERGPTTLDTAAMPAISERRDGHWLAWALGVDATLFSRADHAGSREINLAAAAFIQAASRGDSPLLRRLSLGRNQPADIPPLWCPLPTLQVGASPYSILPAMAPNEAIQSAVGAGGLQARIGGFADDISRRQAVAVSFRNGSNIATLMCHDGRSATEMAVQFADATAVGQTDTTLSGIDTWWRADGVQRSALDAITMRPELWTNALASQRLVDLRESQNSSGLRIGAWGYVEGLCPAEQPTPVAGMTTESPVYQSTASLGYQQTPSLAHAATAAILRNGTRQQPGASTDPLAGIDLSSERVQRALWLLDGVRQGQSLGTLLGYRFERHLQEHRDPLLAQYIARFRTLASVKGDDKISPLVDAVNVATRALEEETFHQLAYDQALVDRDRLQGKLDTLVRQWNQTLDSLRRQQADCGSALDAATTELAQARQYKADIDAARPIQDVAVEFDDNGKPLRININDNKEEYDAWVAQSAAADSQLLEKQSKYDVLVRQKAATDQDLNVAIVRRDNDLELEQARTNLDEAKERLSKLPTADVPSKKTALETAANALKQAVEGSWNQALASSQANRPVDGLELHRRWRVAIQTPDGIWDSRTIPLGSLGFPAVDSPDWKALTVQFQMLAEEVDAVADLSVAESVFQLVRRNPSRGSAALDVLSPTSAAAPPAEYEVIRTPRTGAVVTHRVLLALPAEVPSEDLWATSLPCPRASFEPTLDGWAEAVLRAPGRIVCNGQLCTTDGQLRTDIRIDMAALNLSASTFLTLAAASQNLADGSSDNELALLLTYVYRSQHPDIAPDAVIRWLPQSTTGLAADELALAEAVDLASALHGLISSARPLDARDLAEALPAVDFDEANQRLASLEQVTIAIRDGLEADRNLLEAGVSMNTLAKVKSRLIEALPWRVMGSVPQSEAVSAAETAGRQAKAVADELTKRLNQYSSLIPESTPDSLLERARALLGGDATLLPIVRQSASQTTWHDSMQPNTSLVSPDATIRLATARKWIQQLAYVREGMARLQRFVGYAQIFRTGATRNLSLGQFPWKPGDRWVGLPINEGGSMPRGSIGTLTYHPMSEIVPDSQKTIKGLVIDEWTEVIPSGLDTSAWTSGTTWKAELGADAATTEVTGVSFHFDRPNACAPNVAILALANEASSWSLDLLQRTVMNTVDLARCRAAPADGRTELLWFTDQLPLGARAGSWYDDQPYQVWQWSHWNPIPISGKRSHRTPVVSGYKQHWFTEASTESAMRVEAGDCLVVYVNLSAATAPRALIVQWVCGVNDWEHRAVWCHRTDWENRNADSIWSRDFIWGVADTPSRHWASDVPIPGDWVRLEVPASEVGLEGQFVTGVSFGVVNGAADWGPTGRLLSPANMKRWEEQRNDIIWFVNRPPPGSALFSDEPGGTWQWNSAKPVFRNFTDTPIPSHFSPASAGRHQHWFLGATAPLQIYPGDRMIVWVNPDKDAVPRAVIVQWVVRNAHGTDDWEHRAVWCSSADRANARFWQENFPWGTMDSASLCWRGELPTPDHWCRFEADAAALGLEGQFVSGMGFTLIGGSASWGGSGVSRPVLSNTLILDSDVQSTPPRVDPANTSPPIRPIFTNMDNIA